MAADTDWPAIVSLIGNGTVLAVVVISLAAIAAGHLLAAPDPRDQVALATAAATRHPGIALMVAGGYSPDKRVTAMILLALNDVVTRFTEYYGLVLGLVILAFALGLRRGVLDFLRLVWPGRAK